jgi:hypothetical protein
LQNKLTSKFSSEKVEEENHQTSAISKLIDLAKLKRRLSNESFVGKALKT